MEITTSEEFFENILPKRFDPKKARGITAKINLDISGVNGGKWIVTIENQNLEVKKGMEPDPTITVQMADSDYLDMLNGRLAPEKAFFSGKLRVKGDLMLALKLRGIGLL